MKIPVKKISVLIMALAIITSTLIMPREVKADNFYNITFNANGGYFSSIGSNVRTVKMPSTVALKAASYYSPDLRTNYSFLGWSTSKTATTATYTLNAVLPRTNTTYYAVWRSLSTTGVQITQSNVSVKMGTTHKMTATVLPTYAANKSVKWSSSNTNVLKIASDGTITPVRPGTATVTVTTVSGGYKASTTVKIVQGVNVSVDITNNCDTKQTITYSLKSTGTTDNDKIVSYCFDGIDESITATHATIIKKEVSTSTIHTFVATAANGAKNYTSAIPFYNVTFNSNDGNNITKTYLFNHGAQPAISSTKNMFTREGYCLAGWSTDPNVNEPEDIWVGGAEQYYAVWYKVNISDDPNVISKDIINVKYGYDPTQIYITVTDNEGNIVDYDTTWSTIKDRGNRSVYILESGNLLYTQYDSGNVVTIESSDKLLQGSVKVDLQKNIMVTSKKIFNEDGKCTLVYYVHFKESSLKKFTLDEMEYSSSDAAGYDESTNTYRIENELTSNGITKLEVVGEDNSYAYNFENVNIFEEDSKITTQSTLKDKNGVAAATVTLKCGKAEDNPKGYYFGKSENCEENDFYSLSESNNDNDIIILEGYYNISHYIRNAGTYYYTPVDAEGRKQNTYNITVYEVDLDTNGGKSLEQTKYYVFNNKQIKFSELPSPIHAEKNKIFRGWYLPDGTYTGTKVTKDLTLQARWRTNPFKDKNGNDTGYSFKFEQFRFGFTNFGCSVSLGGHCKAITTLACKFVTAENDFDVSDFYEKKTGATVKSISDFINVPNTEYIDSKTGLTLNDYICGYQHFATGVTKPSSIGYSSIKDVLMAVKNIKNTGVPIQVSVSGVVSSGASAVSMGHALVAYDVVKVKSTSDYTEYSISIYDCNDNTRERVLSIWCNGDEESSDAEWGWKYVWSSTDILGSDYSQSDLSATIYDCNN